MDETRSVQEGEIFEVPLESTPTAGYVWDVEIEDEGKHLLELLRRDFLREQPSMTGSRAKQLFRFRALAPGEVRLVFLYHRPWEQRPRSEYHLLIVISQK